MEAVDIVEALNQYHEEQGVGGQFVLQKKLEPNGTVKAYKELTFILWYINDKKSKVEVLRVNVINRMVSDKEIEFITKQVTTKLLVLIMKFLSSNDYSKLVYGVQ